MMPPLSLLLVNYEYPPIGGGAGNATYHIAHDLAAAGCRVTVLTSRFRGQPAREREGDVTVVRVPVVRRRADRCTPPEMLTFIGSALLRARSVARAARPEACLAFMGLPSGPVAWWLRRSLGIPYLVLLRGGDVPGFLPGELGTYHRLTLPVIRALWRDAAAIVANSEGLRRTAQAGLPGFEIQVIPNGVDTVRFAPAAGERPPGPPRLLFVGRLSAQKNLLTLLEALASLRGRVEGELVLAGDGPERERLAQRAAALGLGKRVRFAGWVGRDELPGLYRGADLFVLPSWDEGMPNALLEAMASGLPVVASRIAGNEELVREGVNGYLVAPDDTAGLAERIARLAAQPDLRRRMGEASRAAAVARDWGPVAAAYLDLARAGATRSAHGI